MRAIVIGGGIGGLATGVALQRAGLDVQVLERTHDPSGAQTGSGLTIWSNAIGALAELGLADAVSAVGSTLERFEHRTSTLGRLASWPVGDYGRELGWPSVNLSRQELHDVLRAALEPATLRTGVRCVAIEDDAHGVTARLEDGDAVHGDVLIGADGLNSVVRGALLGPAAPRYAGYAIWRALVPAGRVELPQHEFTQLWGRGRRFGYYPIGGGRSYWWATLNGPQRPATGQPWGRALRHAFSGWPEPVQSLLAATDEHAISRHGIYDRDPAPRWGRGRVTLLGDAAHPMSFNVGQGACQAIEDAIVLAARLHGCEDPAAALRSYEAERQQRTATIMRRARRIGELAAWEHRISCAVRDRLLRVVLSGPAARQAKAMISPVV